MKKKSTFTTSFLQHEVVNPNKCLCWSQITVHQLKDARVQLLEQFGAATRLRPSFSRRALIVTHRTLALVVTLFLQPCCKFLVVALRDRRAAAEEEGKKKKRSLLFLTEGTWWWSSQPIGEQECVHLSRLAACEMTESAAEPPPPPHYTHFFFLYHEVTPNGSIYDDHNSCPLYTFPRQIKKTTFFPPFPRAWTSHGNASFSCLMLHLLWQTVHAGLRRKRHNIYLVLQLKSHARWQMWYDCARDAGGVSTSCTPLFFSCCFEDPRVRTRIQPLVCVKC